LLRGINERTFLQSVQSLNTVVVGCIKQIKSSQEFFSISTGKNATKNSGYRRDLIIRADDLCVCDCIQVDHTIRKRPCEIQRPSVIIVVDRCVVDIDTQSSISDDAGVETNIETSIHVGDASSIAGTYEGIATLGIRRLPGHILRRDRRQAIDVIGHICLVELSPIPVDRIVPCPPPHALECWNSA